MFDTLCFFTPCGLPTALPTSTEAPSTNITFPRSGQLPNNRNRSISCEKQKTLIINYIKNLHCFIIVSQPAVLYCIYSSRKCFISDGVSSSCVIISPIIVIQKDDRERIKIFEKSVLICGYRRFISVIHKLLAWEYFSANVY